MKQFTENDFLHAWRAFPHTFATKASDGKWRPYNYLKYISKTIAPEIVKGGARYVVSIPPRFGKSEFLSYWLPVWFLELFPEKKIILTSYSMSLASTFGRKIRNEFKTNQLLSTRLRPDSTASHRFDTTKNGGLIAVGAGGSITGKGAHLLLIDDPYKDDKEALSKSHRDNVEEWYKNVARTRLEPKGSIILIMTRWHEADLANFLIKNQGFKEINLPAICTKEVDEIGRKKGESLCPERYNLTDLEVIKKDVGSYSWNALYQQKPIPVEAGLFKRHWWKRYKATPHLNYTVQVWDTAQKIGISNDYSVCATWGMSNDGYFLLDIWKNKLEAPDLERAVQDNYNKFKPKAVVIEDKSSGSSLIQNLKRNTVLPIIAFDPKQRDKQIRAIGVIPLIEAGRCHIPDSAPWVEDFILEHEMFPNAEHDDIVDSTTMALEFFINIENVAQPRARAI